MDDPGILELLRALVRAPSYSGLPRQEEAAALALDAFLRRQGVRSEFVEVREGRPNVIASIEGRRPGRRLVLCGHLDTVGPNAGAEAEAFSAEIRAGRMIGRGTVDMKGALAAMAGALADIQASGGLEAGRLTLAAVIDEEMDSLGAEALIRGGLEADGCVIGEPTENRIAIGHKGLEWIEVTFTGRAAHGSTPEAGINAIAAAAQFAALVETVLAPAFESRRDPILGLPVVNLGTIRGGQQPSMVAADCRLQLDRRWVSTETVEQVYQDFEVLLARVRADRPGLKTSLAPMTAGMGNMVHGPLVIESGHPLVLAAAAALEEAGVRDAGLTVFPAWTDGALISREAGIPTLVWGPGELALAHSAAESVPVDDVLVAARLYAAAARRFTAGG